MHIEEFLVLCSRRGLSMTEVSLSLLFQAAQLVLLPFSRFLPFPSSSMAQGFSLFLAKGGVKRDRTLLCILETARCFLWSSLLSFLFFSSQFLLPSCCWTALTPTLIHSNCSFQHMQGTLYFSCVNSHDLHSSPQRVVDSLISQH